MTGKKTSHIAKGVKLLDDAVAKFGSIPDVHRQLIKVGVEISDTSLYKAAAGQIKTFKPEIQVALTYLVYGGDWRRTGKALEHDYMPKGLKKG